MENNLLLYVGVMVNFSLRSKKLYFYTVILLFLCVGPFFTFSSFLWRGFPYDSFADKERRVARPWTLSGGRIVYLRNTMWKTGKYCQLKCHEPVCCGEGADPCLSLHSRLLSQRLLSSFVSRRFGKRKAISTISLAVQTQSSLSRFQ